MFNLFMYSYFVVTFPLVASSYTVWVNQANGNDDFDCIVKSSEKNPCNNLDFAYDQIVENGNYFDVEIVIQGNYVLQKVFQMDKIAKNVTNISIVGDSVSNTITSNSSGANIVIGTKDIANGINYAILFSNLTFNLKEFGENSTAVIVSWYSPSLEIAFCIFQKNKCSALNIIDTKISIRNTLFSDNEGNSIAKGQVYGKHATFPYGENSAGGAVAIFYTKQHVKPIATLTKNNFIGNRAVSLSEKVIIDSSENSIVFSHTGGAILFAFMNQTFSAKIQILGNCFENNIASIGGGLTLTFHDTTGQNNILISDNLFIRNVGTVCGGGFAITTWKLAVANTILIKNTNFTFNGAQVGAGGRILLQSYQSIYTRNPAMQYITFQNVLFFNNKAASSSGLHINYNLGTGSKPFTPIIFKNVTFANHTTEVYTFSLQGPSAYSGVLLSNRVNLEFQDDNYFQFNDIESSVFISNCELYVKGSVRFFKNSVQTSGGAMTMIDVSHLYLYPNAILQFVENYAPVQGGALFVQTVGFPDMVYKYNPSCFIQYFSPMTQDPIPPSKWQVTIQFVQNGAGLKGAAIYANTITPCIWDEISPYYSFQKSLRWKGFNYTGNYISDKSKSTKNPYSLYTGQTDIATDTTNFKLSYHGNVTVEASPGEGIPFKIVATDELSNSVYSVPFASLKKNKEMKLVQKYFIINPNTDSNKEMMFSYSLNQTSYENVLLNKTEIVEDITFVDSSSSFISNATMRVKVKKCHPGFKFKDNNCECDNSPGSHIIRCENNLVYLEEGYWGYQDVKGNFKVNQCPPNFCFCNQTDPTKLGCAFNQSSQCEAGRTGTLCGECKAGKGLDLMTLECVDCGGFSWSLVVIIIVAVATVGVVILILAINPKFSTLLRSILFFVQMLPYVLDARLSFNKVMLSVLGWLDVGGINSVPVKSCFVEHFNSMYAVALGYLYPCLISIILLIVYILHKCYYVNLKRSSPFQAFWILIVLVYKFLVETSLLLLFCVPLNDEISERRVFYLDGSVQCFEGQHLTMTFIATIVLFLVVLPPPILVPLIVKGYFNVGPGIIDALTQGLGKHVRWWWSFDFLRRIIFISIYVFVSDAEVKQILLTVCCVLTLSYHIQKQPYRNQTANNGESFLLLCLTIIVVIEPGSNGASKFDHKREYATAGILMLAAAYCVAITLYVWIAYFVKRCRTRGYAPIDDLDKDSGDEGMYKESIRRRISGRGFAAEWLKSPVSKLKKSHSDNLTGRRAPSPVYTRSDLHDFM